MGKGWVGNRQPVKRRPTWKTDTMHWTLSHNTDSRSVWTSGDYECIGWGRTYGKKLVRDWEIRFKGKRLDTASRLSEAKAVAERHRTEQAHTPDLDPAIAARELRIRQTEVAILATLSQRRRDTADLSLDEVREALTRVLNQSTPLEARA